MESLQRDAELIAAIETVVTSNGFPVVHQDEYPVRRNLRLLMPIYMRLAADNRHDVIPFLQQLSGEIREQGLRAVYNTFGPGGYKRRTEIPRILFDYICEHYPSGREVFERYHRIGILHFAQA